MTYYVGADSSSYPYSAVCEVVATFADGTSERGSRRVRERKRRSHSLAYALADRPRRRSNLRYRLSGDRRRCYAVWRGGSVAVVLLSGQRPR